MRLLKFIAIAAIVVVAGLLFLWWEGRPPKRPSSLPPNAIYKETGFLLFRVKSTPGIWLGCWLDVRDNSDHCKVTDENGKLEFEGVFLPYEGPRPVPQGALVFDPDFTGGLWVGSYEKGIRVPAIFLTNGQILLPEAAFDESRRSVDMLERAAHHSH